MPLKVLFNLEVPLTNRPDCSVTSTPPGEEADRPLCGAFRSDLVRGHRCGTSVDLEEGRGRRPVTALGDPKQCGHTRGSYGSGKAAVLRSVCRAAVSGQFAAIYSTKSCFSTSSNGAFQLRRLVESGGRQRVLLATVLSLRCCADFRTRW